MSALSIILFVLFELIFLAFLILNIAFLVLKKNKGLKAITIIEATIVLVLSSILINFASGGISLSCGKSDGPKQIDLLDNENKPVKIISFGTYPRTVVDNTYIISQLNKLDSTNSRGYYEYNGKEYAYLKATPQYYYDYFTSGKECIEGNSYWFLVEPIEWVSGYNSYGEELYLSLNILDAHYYADDYYDGYAESKIRNWLTHEFFDGAFTYQFDQIKYQWKRLTAHLVTSDLVMLSSFDDQFNSEYRRAKVTDYAIACGVVHDGEYGYWWLIPDNENGIHNYCCNPSGNFFIDQYQGNLFGVRPTIQLSD